MRIRLYGGGGHGRMVYIPASVAVPPPRIAVPTMDIRDFEILAQLDPELETASAALSYAYTRDTDPDGYLRYIYVE